MGTAIKGAATTTPPNVAAILMPMLSWTQVYQTATTAVSSLDRFMQRTMQRRRA